MATVRTGVTTEVVDAAERQRYEIVRDGTVLGFAAYRYLTTTSS